jgi:hypothetical protein
VAKKKKQASGPDYQKLRVALGIASAAVGAAAVFAPRQPGRALGVKGRKARDGIFDFGLAELAAGAMVLHDPRNATNTWIRLSEEGVDLMALLVAMSRAKRKGAVAAAVGLVGALMLADVFAARRLAAQ